MTKVLATEGFRVSKWMVWATIQKYKTHGMISHLPGSGRPFKLTHEMLDAIEEQMKQDDGTSDPARENAGRTWFQDLDAQGQESQGGASGFVFTTTAFQM